MVGEPFQQCQDFNMNYSYSLMAAQHSAYLMAAQHSDKKKANQKGDYKERHA
jgi:hypothetical protein